MTQVCSITNCSAVIAIPEGQEASMFNDKTMCAKCDRLLNAPLPPIPARQNVPKAYKEPEAYQIYTYLPRPKPGYAIMRVQVPDGAGGMQYEYVSRLVEPEKMHTHAKLVKFVTNWFHFTQWGSQS